MFKMSSPAYLMYPDDILSSGRVAALEPLEELWYRRAIDLGWKPGGMPANVKEFAGWVGRGCTVAAARKIMKKFYKPHKKDKTLVVNDRQEIERKKFFKKQKQKSEAGKKGMASRWKQKGKGDNTVITEDNIPIPIPIPISSLDLKRLIERTREENSDADPRIVEIAVIETLLNRNGSTEPIHSIKYFTPAVERLCSKSGGLGAATIDVVLKRRREQILKPTGMEIAA